MSKIIAWLTRLSLFGKLLIALGIVSVIVVAAVVLRLPPIPNEVPYP